MFVVISAHSGSDKKSESNNKNKKQHETMSASPTSELATRTDAPYPASLGKEWWGLSTRCLSCLT